MDAELTRLRDNWPGQNVAADIIGVSHPVMQQRVRDLGLPALKPGPKPGPNARRRVRGRY